MPRTDWYSFPRNEWYSLSVFCRHDGAPNEIEADKGEEVFKDFNKYVDNHFGKDSLINLMNTTENTHVYFGTDEYKIRMINIYWNSYQDSKNEK